MARLHEYQGKPLLAKAGIGVPRGGVAASPEQAEKVAASLGGPVVLKIQAWTTGRARLGGVAFADTPAEARVHAERLLAIRVGNFPVTEVLVEEKIAIARELFVSLSIDDRERAPVMLVSLKGGSGVEERAANVRRFVCDVTDGIDRGALAQFVGASDVPEQHQTAVADAIHAVFAVARQHEARSVEINPLVITPDGRVMAADCRITIDDYAVFRHADLGIDIARELDHPPTALEKIAYALEQADHRGTFYFAQMNTAAAPGSKGLIGFHGAGGGGSMMSMDAITSEGFTIANFCDTSGNPSPAKVYRAARIILVNRASSATSAPARGVANQEQFWSAYGLAKAFWEMNLDIPAVIRLGGNTEDRAVAILHHGCKGLPAKVEGYKKTDPPAMIAARFAELVREHQKSGGRDGDGWQPRAPRRPAFVGTPRAVPFAVKDGRVWIDTAAWKQNALAILSRSNGLLRDNAGKPAITVKAAEFLAKDSDMIACEVECRRDAVGGPDGAVFVELDVPGLGRRGGPLMAILIDQHKKVIVQGITGREGQARTRLMLDYGTNVVGGVTPGKGGTRSSASPSSTPANAGRGTRGVDISVLFVPAARRSRTPPSTPSTPASSSSSSSPTACPSGTPWKSPRPPRPRTRASSAPTRSASPPPARPSSA